MEIEKIIKENQDYITNQKKQNIATRFKLSCTQDEAKKLFWSIAQKYCEVKSHSKYVVDESNIEQINEILKYLRRDEDFKGDLTKGLFLSGNVGTGKTMIMFVIKEMLELCRKIMEIYDADEISNYYASNSEDNLNMRNKLYQGIICIDDLGSEKSKVVNFGTSQMPIYEVMLRRYRDNRLTFITTNISAKQLSEVYDDRFADRCKEMFNVIVLQGKSRRK